MPVLLLSVKGLQSELNSMSWIDTAYVERVWPDTLKLNSLKKARSDLG